MSRPPAGWLAPRRLSWSYRSRRTCQALERRSCLTCCCPTALVSWRSSDGTSGSAKLTAATAGPASSVTCGCASGTGEHLFRWQIIRSFLHFKILSSIFPVSLQKHYAAAKREDYQWLRNSGSTSDASGAAQVDGDPAHPEAPDPGLIHSAWGQLGPRNSGSQHTPAGDGFSLDLIRLDLLLTTWP